MQQQQQQRKGRKWEMGEEVHLVSGEDSSKVKRVRTEIKWERKQSEKRKRLGLDTRLSRILRGSDFNAIGTKFRDASNSSQICHFCLGN